MDLSSRRAGIREGSAIQVETEQSPDFGYSYYTLSHAEMGALVANLGIDPHEGSPLTGFAPGAAAGDVPEGGDELVDAIAILAGPDSVAVLRQWPHGGGPLRFYGVSGSQDRVMMAGTGEEDGCRLIWPVSEAVLVTLVTTSLTAQPAEDPRLIPSNSPSQTCLSLQLSPTCSGKAGW